MEPATLTRDDRCCYDLTQMSSGTRVVPYERAVSPCQHCKRMGIEFTEHESGFVIHTVGPQRWISDYCAPSGAWWLADPARSLPGHVMREYWGEN